MGNSYKLYHKSSILLGYVWGLSTLRFVDKFSFNFSLAKESIGSDSKLAFANTNDIIDVKNTVKRSENRRDTKKQHKCCHYDHNI